MRKFRTHKSGFIAVLALLAVAIIITYAYAALKTETNQVTYTDHQRFRSKVTFGSTNINNPNTILFDAYSSVTTASGATTVFENTPQLNKGFRQDIVLINGLEDLSAWSVSGASYFQTQKGKTYLVDLTSIATKQNAKDQWGSATTGIRTFSAVSAILPYADDPFDSNQTVTIIKADSSTTQLQVWAGVPSGTTEWNMEGYASKAQTLQNTWSTTTNASGVSDWSINNLGENATWMLWWRSNQNEGSATSAYKINQNIYSW